MRKKRKILLIIFGVFMLANVVGVALNWRNIQMIATYNPILLPPMYGKPETVTEARLQDLRYLRKLPSIDRSFTEEERVQFTGVIDDLEARASALSDAEIYLGISKAVAFADNGHTNTSDQPLYRQFNTISAKTYWFADGLFIVRAEAEHAGAVGSHIVAIEGASLDAVTKALSQYRGGAQQWRKLAMGMMIQSPEIMHAAGLAASPGEVIFTLEGANGHKGHRRDVVFKGHSPEGRDALPRRYPWLTLASEALPDESGNWTRTLQVSNGPTPLYLRDTDAPLFASLPGNGHYIRTRTGFGTKELSIPAFFDAALAGIDDGTLDYLVVDYRLNGGGDYLRSIDFTKLAPRKVKEGGKLYLLVGPNTFSASIVTVAMLKYHGGDKAMIIGSPMGDHEQFWAERGMGFKLPNSELYVNYATGFHDWNKGCNDQKYCFTFNRIHGVRAGSLAPVVTLEPTYGDYASGRDIVMGWVRSRHGHAGELID